MSFAMENSSNSHYLQLVVSFPQIKLFHKQPNRKYYQTENQYIPPVSSALGIENGYFVAIGQGCLTFEKM